MWCSWQTLSTPSGRKQVTAPYRGRTSHRLSRWSWLLIFIATDQQQEGDKMDLRPMAFKDTASMMLSGDCKERFQAEYGQLRLRYQKLKGDTYETKISNEFTAVCRGWSIWRPGRRRRSFWSSRNRQQHRRTVWLWKAGRAVSQDKEPLTGTLHCLAILRGSCSVISG